MAIYEHLAMFGGRPVVEFVSGQPFADPAANIPALRVGYDDDHTAVDLLRELLQSESAEQIPGLVIGAWSGELYENTPSEIIEALVAAADKLPQIRALFIGDITSEENEISWIQQTDLSALWDAFPRLEFLGIRGGNNLSLGRMRLNHLRELTIQSGGLPKSVLAELAQAHLPVLERLELYLGTDEYGWDGRIDDVRPLLTGQLFSQLKHLGLCDSQIADEVAVAVAQSPLLSRLESLDLSLGTLGDEGAAALLASDAARRLKKLDLHHHYMSSSMMQQIAGLGPDVDVSDQQTEEEYGRYVSIGE